MRASEKYLKNKVFDINNFNRGMLDSDIVIYGKLIELETRLGMTNNSFVQEIYGREYEKLKQQLGL